MRKMSDFLKKKKPIIKELIARLNEKYAYVSVLGTDVCGTSIDVDAHSTYVRPASISECGFVIRVYQNGYSEYSINDINKQNIEEIIKAVDELVGQKTSIEKVNAKVLSEEKLIKKFVRKPKGMEYSVNEIIDILKSYVSFGMQTIKNVVFIQTSVELVSISKIFISTSKDLEQFYTWDNFRSMVMVREGENTKYAYDGFGDNNTEEGLLKLKESIKTTGELANDLLKATTPVPGVYDIITDPSITGLIAHEAFGHGVEMDMFVKDRAQAKEFINKQVASPLVSMHDGADATYSVASYFFDDDGVLAQDTKIIEKGILKRGISDAISAMELGTTPTGNGRRQSYKRKAYTRMTNTFFEKGTSKVEDMIKSIDYGYYIGITNNGMEDPKNWGIQCTALYGREIKNGKFTGKMISPVVMSGHVIDLLNSISAVSDDFVVIGSGSCGKGYKEWVRVSDGGPCLKAKVKIG